MPFDQRSLIHREAWFPPCFVSQNQQTKKNFFLRGDFKKFSNKNVQMLDHFFPLLSPKDSESLKILDSRLWEVGAKRRLNGTSKVNGQTHRRTFQLIESIDPEGRCFENFRIIMFFCANNLWLNLGKDPFVCDYCLTILRKGIRRKNRLQFGHLSKGGGGV